MATPATARWNTWRCIPVERSELEDPACPPRRSSHAGDKLESDLRGADLTKLVVGAPDGWDSLMGRIKELTSTDATAMQTALRNAFGSDVRSKVEQLELRRQAVQTEPLKRLVSHEDEIITGMPKLLVELVKTTPLSMDTLRDRR